MGDLVDEPREIDEGVFSYLVEADELLGGVGEGIGLVADANAQTPLLVTDDGIEILITVFPDGRFLLRSYGGTCDPISDPKALAQLARVIGDWWLAHHITIGIAPEIGQVLLSREWGSYREVPVQAFVSMIRVMVTVVRHWRACVSGTELEAMFEEFKGTDVIEAPTFGGGNSGKGLLRQIGEQFVERGMGEAVVHGARSLILVQAKSYHYLVRELDYELEVTLQLPFPAKMSGVELSREILSRNFLVAGSGLGEIYFRDPASDRPAAGRLYAISKQDPEITGFLHFINLFSLCCSGVNEWITDLEMEGSAMEEEKRLSKRLDKSV